MGVLGYGVAYNILSFLLQNLPDMKSGVGDRSLILGLSPLSNGILYIS